MKVIKNIELFATGTWSGHGSRPGGDKYTRGDLEAMVDAFNGGALRPKIKVTHGSDTEQVNVGEIGNLRVVGNKLLGDFINLDGSLYELMQRGLFKKRSAEVLWNMRDRGGKLWSKVLKAVALLAPGQKPAVSAISEGYQFEALYCYEVPQHYRDIVGPAIERWSEWAGSAERAVLIFKSKLAWMPKRSWRVAVWLEREATGEWPTVTVPVDQDAKSPTKVKTEVPYLDNDELDDYAPSLDDLSRIAELMIRILPTGSKEKEVREMTQYAAAMDEVNRLLNQGLSPDQIKSRFPVIWKTYNAGPKDSPPESKDYHAQLEQEEKEKAKHMKDGGIILDRRARQLLDSGKVETYKKAFEKAMEEDPQTARAYLKGIGG